MHSLFLFYSKNAGTHQTPLPFLSRPLFTTRVLYNFPLFNFLSLSLSLLQFLSLTFCFTTPSFINKNSQSYRAPDESVTFFMSQNRIYSPHCCKTHICFAYLSYRSSIVRIRSTIGILACQVPDRYYRPPPSLC